MKYIAAIDYDGTLFTKSWPELGEPRQEVIKKVKEFKKAGADIVLWTCREGKSLQEALSRCSTEGLEFVSVNENSPSAKEYQDSQLEANGDVFGLRKIYADIYVDDKSPGSIEHFLNLDAKKEVEKRSKEKD